MIGLLIPALAIVILIVSITWLTGGTIQGATSIQVKGTAAAPGTASSSSIKSITTTITGSAQEALTFGTSSGQVNIIIAQDRTLAASSNETLDINTGLSDIFGAAAATMLHLKYVSVYIVSGGDTTGLTIVSGASNGFTGYGINSTGITIYPNGPGFQNGEPVTGLTVSSTAANIKLTNNSTSVSVTYRITLGGTTT